MVSKLYNRHKSKMPKRQQGKRHIPSSRYASNGFDINELRKNFSVYNNPELCNQYLYDLMKEDGEYLAGKTPIKNSFIEENKDGNWTKIDEHIAKQYMKDIKNTIENAESIEEVISDSKPSDSRRVKELENVKNLFTKSFGLRYILHPNFKQLITDIYAYTKKNKISVQDCLDSIFIQDVNFLLSNIKTVHNGKVSYNAVIVENYFRSETSEVKEGNLTEEPKNITEEIILNDYIKVHSTQRNKRCGFVNGIVSRNTNFKVLKKMISEKKSEVNLQEIIQSMKLGLEQIIHASEKRKLNRLQEYYNALTHLNKNNVPGIENITQEVTDMIRNITNGAKSYTYKPQIVYKAVKEFKEKYGPEVYSVQLEEEINSVMFNLVKQEITEDIVPNMLKQLSVLLLTELYDNCKPIETPDVSFSYIAYQLAKNRLEYMKGGVDEKNLLGAIIAAKQLINYNAGEKTNELTESASEDIKALYGDTMVISEMAHTMKLEHEVPNCDAIEIATWVYEANLVSAHAYTLTDVLKIYKENGLNAVKEQLGIE